MGEKIKVTMDRGSLAALVGATIRAVTEYDNLYRGRPEIGAGTLIDTEARTYLLALDTIADVKPGTCGTLVRDMIHKHRLPQDARAEVMARLKLTD